MRGFDGDIPCVAMNAIQTIRVINGFVNLLGEGYEEVE
jgi:hypothetical protein